MYARIFSALTFALVVQSLGATTNDVTFNVRQQNGADQYYRLEVPPNLPPAKADAGKISQNQAAIIAVGWAGGLEDTGGLTNLGASKPGGFYNATYIKVDSIQFKTSPVAYYVVQMSGKIGQDRQTFFAAVLEDGRIVRPTAASGPEKPQKVKRHGRANH
jgi:hypothetical protein